MHRLMELLLQHGYWVLGAWVAAEQLGVPIPAVPILLAMGALMGTGRYSFVLATSVALCAAVFADTAWYVLGRSKGSSVLKLLCRISLEPDSCVNSAQSWFAKLGAWALVVAKFVPGLSTIATPMAGLARMPVWRFLFADAAGTVIWTTAIMGIGFAFRPELEYVGELAARLGSGFVVAVVAALALWLLLKYWQRRRFIKSLRVARIAPEEVLERLSEFAIVDLRSATELESDGMTIPGALWFDRSELRTQHDKIPRDRDVILYCT